MNRLRNARRSITYSAVLAVAALPAISPPSRAQPDTARMQQIIQYYVGAGRYMGSVLVVSGDRVLIDKGYGSADLEWDIPNTPDTKFRLGSITKQFTAAAILQLEEQGKLKTDDLVKKYLPDAPVAWDRITIYHLLTHTSGIPNFTSFPDYSATEALPTTPEKLVARFRDKPLDFAPGTRWSYSNSGYVLLGYLIERISGQKYQDYLQQHIFTPLGMTETGYDSNKAIIHHHASGYSPGEHGPVNAGYIDMTIPFSAGALYSTTGDLRRWEEGLFGGKVISRPELEKMTTPFKEDYACGLAVQTVNGHRTISHGGGIEGFNTFLSYAPDDRLVVVVLGNLNGDAPDAIAGKLAAVVHGETVVLPSERKVVTLPSSVLAPYVGTYQFGTDFSLRVAQEGDRLLVRGEGQEPFPLFAESETTFFSKAVDAEFEFRRDGAGRVTGLVLHQGGRDMTGTRK